MTAESGSLWPLDDSCNIQFDYAQLQLINNSINRAKSHLRITRNNCAGDMNNDKKTTQTHAHTDTLCNSIRLDYFEACPSGQKTKGAEYSWQSENSCRNTSKISTQFAKGGTIANC